MTTLTTENPSVAAEAARRRSIAVISHPDAGKSTLTEALALHARAIDEAGAVHGKGNRSGVVSDWLEMEQKRGISITSAALQFVYRDVVINLLDTPGHADFSEDTYRVLTAVDAAVMLLDSAKGLEPQTLKLFEVCRRRGVPVITFVNKWDRPGREVLDLCDELEERIGLRPTPVTWPVGEAGRFLGLLDRQDGHVTRYRRTPGGASLAEEETLDASRAADELDDDYTEAVEGAQLLDAVDVATFRSGETTPLLFGAALANIGVRQLLDAVVDLAPAPGARPTADGGDRPVEAPFSGFVFKMQAGMDPKHRDHVAYIRVCSGRFERGMNVTHEPSGRPFATKYALSVFGRERSTVEDAYPGDVVGLVNAGALAVGDTVHEPSGPPVRFPPMPAFEPEHFAVARSSDPGRSKQFRKGMSQLEQEGVVQVLVSDLRGDASPVLAAVGPLQFEVAAFRMEHEFSAPMVLETLSLSVARYVDPAHAAAVAAYPGAEVARRRDGATLALLRDVWHARAFERGHPDIALDPLTPNLPSR
ncbi:peptide chain release factor 3 [Isoptericola sp. CG 20/1183]|uniref:Peptide chain release factor 3 n=1 Tax=Isoptericola halotolerans TaxID=300560 RepID=A0ABX5EI34_9MICO|nr:MULTISPECIES: peptide chain release factor 3 [Isoptericola]PRZ04202.1 peptide chain release factor 3 [Isoptericola sp. CG 20/1183]PRZ09973.1 peptide chain release factor 3 [Isoptericola halotolerans]